MILKHYTKLELEELLVDTDFWNKEIIPISRNRILSQINNPRCSPEDILLSTITQDEKLEGFIGFLPEFIQHNEIVKKVFWISTWWANPDSTLRGVGTILLLKALPDHQQKLGVSIFTDDAKKIYDQLGLFTTIKNFNGFHRIYALSFDQFSKKILKTQRFDRLFKLVFYILNQCIFLIQNVSWVFMSRDYSAYTTNSIEILGEEVQRFISPFLENDLTKRDIEIFNWVKKYPWVTPKPDNHQSDPAYPFSRYCDILFEQKNILIRNEQGEIVVLMIAVVRDDTLKVPYIFCAPESYPIAAKEILRIIKEKKISIATIFNEQLNRALNKGLPHIRIPYRREMIVTDQFRKEITPSDVNIQDGEADWIFT